MSQVPDEFMCPITTSIMLDPVLASDGHTYERSAITEWLRVHATSPMTREPMNVQGLRPNHSLKSMIQRFNAIPAVTVAPVQPNQVENDHYYAISVYQEEVSKPKPIPSVSSVPIRSGDIQSNKKKLLTICAALIFIIIMVIIIKMFQG